MDVYHYGGPNKYVVTTFDGKLIVVAAPSAKAAVAAVEAKGLAMMKVHGAGPAAVPMMTVPAVPADGLAAAILALEVAEDDYAAAAWAVEVKRRSYGYYPGASSKREDVAYLKGLAKAVELAASRVGAEASAAWPADDPDAWPAFGRWLADR